MGKMKKGPKKGLADSRKKSAPPKPMNPFEIHVNRQKFQVLGRKLKADRGLPGVARAKALKKRKETLLQEYKLKDKSNKFVDRRIGEKNSAMTAEDKMTARFTAERLRAQNRKAMFNLADDEVLLTHRGQTLNEIERFDDPRSDDEDDEDIPLKSKGHLDADFVGDAHFGGGLLSRANDDGGKSRKDLIDQLIAESKKRKAEQQRLKDQTLDLTEKLDTEWKDLLPVLTAGPKASDVEKPKIDSYDTLMRELRFEARGKPSDRLKSVDEVAREEKEKLEELEAARLKRMQGIVDTSAETVPKHRSADDLDDGFVMDTIDDEDDADADDADADNGGEMDNDRESNNDGSDGEDDEQMESEDDDEEKESESDEESSDEDDIADLKYDSSDEDNAEAGSDDSSDGSTKAELEKSKGKIEPSKKSNPSKESSSSVEKAEAIREDLKKRKELMESARKELPYTFEVPSSYEELCIALAGRSPEYQGVIVERMIKCTHPSLGSENKEKLSQLFTFLMQHLHDAGIADENENVCWAILDRIAPSLFDIVQWCPEDTAQCVRHIVQEKQQDYRKSRKAFPGVETIMFFKLISLLYPTSDFRHPVVTPALVFMGQILSRCRIESRQDVARGLLIVSLLLEYTALSKRYSPESVNFLRNVLFLTSKFPSTQKVNNLVILPHIRPIPPVKFFPPPSISLRPNVEKNSDSHIEPNDRLKASDLIGTEPVDDVFCLTSLFTSTRILSLMVTQLSSQPACRHIFSPFPPLLQSLLEEKWVPQKVREEIENLQNVIDSVKESKLKFIVAAPKRPKPLKLYEPSIQHVYADGKQSRPASREKQETEKLLHRVKRERKGALREIRKDRDFLAKIRMKEQLKSDSERIAKVKEIFGDASSQQGELKKFDRSKKK